MLLLFGQMKRYTVSVFLNVDEALICIAIRYRYRFIYVVMWCNQKWITKSQKVLIDRKGADWLKSCLLNENVPIIEKVPIEK